MVKPHSPQKPTAERSTLMTDGEFEDFWAGLFVRRMAAANEVVPTSEASDETREAAATRGRSSKPTHQRCGTCRGCTANDCGACKNCRDKPRFGGPGIKKKACQRRVCYKARNRDDDDDDEDDEETTAPPSTAGGVGSSTSEPASAVTSPALRPSSPSDVPPAAEGSSCETRQPLEDLTAEPNSTVGCQLDVLSRMASTIGAV